MSSELDALIQRADRSDRDAADALFRLLYRELHRLAQHQLRRVNASLTLGTTTLIHEAYLNITGRPCVSFEDRPRFLAYASRAMRGLVIDYARRRRARRRGRQFEVTLDNVELDATQRDDGADLVCLGDALDELADLDPVLAELVDLHFFCGLSFAELATIRGVSERTVQRDWRKARMLLHHALLDDEPASG